MQYRKIIFALFGIFFSVNLFATHNVGGYITVTQIAPLTFQAKIVTFTKMSSIQADRDTLNLNWGDNSQSERVVRSNGPIGSHGIPLGVAIGNDIKMNEYISGFHTYPGYLCEYIISVSDPNRVSNIININHGGSGNINPGGSVNVPLYFETRIRPQSQNHCMNSSPVLETHPHFFALTTDTLTFNMTASDHDGDSLSFEFTTPLQASGFPVPNYVLPHQIVPGPNNQISIHPVTGEIKWHSPQRLGIYVVAVKISEWKNGELYGNTIVDFNITVYPDTSSRPHFTTNWQLDSTGAYSFTVIPGDTLQLDFSATADIIFFAGEIFRLASSPDFNFTGIAPSLQGNFYWIPDVADARITPYITTFRAGKNHSIGTYLNDLTVSIYVSGAPLPAVCAQTSNCFTSVSENGKPYDTRLYPNPFTHQFQIELSAQSAGENLSLQLFDVQGKQIRQVFTHGATNLLIERGNLPAGIYIYRLTKENGERVAEGKVAAL